ncbi:IS66 family insertion sequence element accessory protein TnpB [Variovorax sp. H27-G14]|uniref:IS66 family insertion sequence element accessory protein TnpB n=1 Tax=Variovorax sp. H27-G14 TaxID=3111914 RepID=UPI0038FC7017
MAADPVDMRANAERLLARVLQVFGAVQAHHGYLFANARGAGTGVKLLVHDGFGVWCAARRLNAGRFVWPGTTRRHPCCRSHLRSSTFWSLGCRGSAFPS